MSGQHSSAVQPSAPGFGSPRQVAAPVTLREKVWYFIDNDARFTLFVMLAIFISTLTYILDTYITEPTAHEAFWVVEVVAVCIFTVEYTVKILCAPSAYKFAKQPLSVIDLVAIVPFWVEMFIQAVLQGEANINLSWVRVLRLFRVFRIFKVGKLTFGFKIFLAAIKMSMTSFTILIFFMCILIILSSSLMYMFENNDPPHPAQARPDLFATIPDCMWWSIVTMTTVGYGDAVPATAPGKIVATFTMCLGLLTIALPVTVLGSNFTKVMDMYEEELDMYSSADTDGSGTVSEDELRFFLYSKRQQGLISDEYKQTAAQLMQRFDIDNKGHLNREEFKRLVQSIALSYEQTRPPTTQDLMKQLEATADDVMTLDDRIIRLETMVEALCAASNISVPPPRPMGGRMTSTGSLPAPAAAQGGGFVRRNSGVGSVKRRGSSGLLGRQGTSGSSRGTLQPSQQPACDAAGGHAAGADTSSSAGRADAGASASET